MWKPSHTALTCLNGVEYVYTCMYENFWALNSSLTHILIWEQSGKDKTQIWYNCLEAPNYQTS